MRGAARQQFRWAPHTIGATNVKPKDYEASERVEASGVYAAWLALKDSERALEIGDVLESECGSLRIYKYVGFEEAQWQLPEVKVEDAPVSPGQTTSA
jgi:hypothetical protein